MLSYATYPDLDTRMREAGATNMSLAQAAGVGVATVARLRNGSEVRSDLIEYVCEALATRTFSYQKKGPKGPWKNL